MKSYFDVLEINHVKNKHVISIGNFDGVHIGHKALLNTVITRAKELSVRTAVVTFDPHPLYIINPDKAPKLLMTIDQRINTLSKIGLDLVWVINFDKNIAQLGTQSFLDKLFRSLNPVEIHIGADFRFGNKRCGDLKELNSWGNTVNCKIYGHNLYSYKNKIVTSTKIRSILESGAIEDANILLGHTYSLNGNLNPYYRCNYQIFKFITTQSILLNNGIYIAKVTIPEISKSIFSLINIHKSNFANNDACDVMSYLISPSKEDILDPSKLLYNVEISFVRRVKNFLNFTNPDDMNQQIPNILFHNKDLINYF